MSDNNVVGVYKKEENKCLQESMTKIINGLKEMVIVNQTELEKRFSDSKSKLESKLDEVANSPTELSNTVRNGRKITKHLFLKAELEFGIKNLKALITSQLDNITQDVQRKTESLMSAFDTKIDSINTWIEVIELV